MRKKAESVVLLFIILTTDTCLAHTSRFLSPGAVLDHQEAIGRIVISNQNIVYFEYVRPPSKAPYYFPYENKPDSVEGRKLLMVADIEGDAVPKQLFPQDTQSAYRFAGENPLAPDKKSIGVFRINGQTLTPGVFSTDKESIKFFDRVSASIRLPFFNWVSETEFIVLEEFHGSGGGLVREGRFYGPVARADTWDEAWRQRSVTSSVLGSGKYETIAYPRPKQVLSKVNTRTARREVLLERPGIAPLLSSSSGRYLLAFFSNGPKLDFSDEINSLHLNDSGYVIVDTETGGLVDLSGEFDVAFTPFAFSPNETKFLFSVKTASAENGQTEFQILDLATKNITSHLGGEIYRSAGRKEDIKRSSPRLRSVFWVDEQSFIHPQANTSASRIDWIRISLSGECEKITQAISGDPGRPISKSGSEVFFVVDGDVLAVTSGSKPRSLSEQYAPLAVYRAPDKRSALPSIEELAFYSESQGRLLVLDASGGELAAYDLPESSAEIHEIQSASMTYSLHRRGHESALMFSHSSFDGNKISPRLLWSYNAYLKDVETTGKPVRVDYDGPGGQELYGWIYLPAGQSKVTASKHPLVTIAYAERLFGWNDDEVPADKPWNVTLNAPVSVQMFTSAGYAVLLPSIPLDWAPSNPMVDMMPSINAAVDAAIASGIVDEDRLALTGHSFGGYTALAVAVQSNRFDVLIASSSQSNLSSLYGTFYEQDRYQPFTQVPAYGFGQGVSFIGMEQGQHRMGAPPWRDEERYNRNSPVFHAEAVETPVMLIHGDLDFIPMAQAEEMFTALVREGKDAQFIRYWGEPHSVLRPQNQRDMWSRVLAFLEDNGVTPGPKAVH